MGPCISILHFPLAKTLHGGGLLRLNQKMIISYRSTNSIVYMTRDDNIAGFFKHATNVVNNKISLGLK